jgi:4-amino-4-deoxy-L-arabinose transferase-like glycosyltransferase
MSARGVAALLLGFAAVWLALLAATSLAPPVDNIEQLTWVRSLEWGYYKHPPLPTFLLWLPAQVLGVCAWTTYVLGAAVTLGAMALLWHFLRIVRGPAHASTALLAMLCITFYNGRLYYYNHNVVLMAFVVGSALLAWKAVQARRWRWWAATGIALGLGALAKYQIAVTVACLLAFHASQDGWRDAAHRRGLLLAGAMALLVFLPHLLWLPAHGYAPVRYALDSSLAADLPASRRWGEALHWLADQVFNRALPALVLLAVTARAAGRRAPGRGPQARPSRDAARALLLCWGFVPLAFMPLTSILAGSDLQLQWGTAFLLFFVPAVMELACDVGWAAVPPRAAWRAFAVLQCALLLVNFVTSPRGSKSLVDTHWRTFDAPSLAQQLLPPARAALGGPVRVIMGSGAEPGALALLFPERPLVLIDGRYDRSPWVPHGLVESCGALQIVRALAAPSGTTPLQPPFSGLHWRVIAPTKPGAPCR